MPSAGASPITGLTSHVPFVVTTVRVALAVAVVNICVGALGAGGHEVVVLVSAAGFLLLMTQAVALYQSVSCAQALADTTALGEALQRLWGSPWRSVVPAVTAFVLAAFVPPLPSPSLPTHSGTAAATAVATLAVGSLLIDTALGAWTYELSRGLFPTGGVRYLAPGVGRGVRSLQWGEAAVMIALAVAEGALVALYPPRPTVLAIAAAAATTVVVVAGAAVALLRLRAVADDVLDTEAWRRLGLPTAGVAVAAAAGAVLNVVALAEPTRLLPAATTGRAAVAGVALGVVVTTCLSRGAVHRGHRRP